MALVLTSLGQSQIVFATSYGRASFGPRELERIRILHKSAPRASSVAADSLWFEISALAVFGLGDLVGPSKNRQELERILKEGCTHLRTQSLAALAGHTPNAIVSRVFQQRLIDQARDKSNPWARWAMAEAAADCRDAGWREWNTQARAFECDGKIDRPAGWAAGGSVKSVYRIAILASKPTDTTDVARIFERGLRAGLKQVLGSGASRVVISRLESARSPAALPRYFDWETSRNAGLLVVPSDADIATAAFAMAHALRILAVDARPASEVAWDTEEAINTRSRWFQSPLHFVLPPGLFDSTLSIADSPFDVASGVVRDSVDWSLAPLTTRPPEWERARRLAQELRARPDLKRVAIALPEVGGNVELARAFGSALDALKREGIPIRYRPGRRNYGPEVAELRESRAQAVLLAGPSEESGEWLRALREAALPMVVLGGIDLDPSGFHDRERKGLEGAILVGDEWAERNPAQVDAAAAAFGLTDSGLRSTFGRGFRFGRDMARGLQSGAITLDRLNSLLAVGPPRGIGWPFSYARTSLRGRDRVAPEIEVPLFRVAQGALVSIPWSDRPEP